MKSTPLEETNHFLRTEKDQWGIEDMYVNEETGK